jgi:hypothetical protein
MFIIIFLKMESLPNVEFIKFITNMKFTEEQISKLKDLDK